MVEYSDDILFDKKYYLSQFTKEEKKKLKLKSKEELLEHYHIQGWKLNLNPSVLFDNNFYLAAYKNDLSKDESPLSHFIKKGAGWGYKPHILFDASSYIAYHAKDSDYDGNPLIHYLISGADKNYNPHLYFDTEWYRKKYLRFNKTNPLKHYLLKGWKKGYRCHPTYFVDDRYTGAKSNKTFDSAPILEYLKNEIPNPLISEYNIINSGEFKKHCEYYANKYGVTPDIHPEDMTMIYHVFLERFKLDYSMAIESYIRNGQVSMNTLFKILNDCGLDVSNQHISLLEFASGFGRVSRFFVKNSNLSLTVSDIHPKAMEFLERKLSVKSYLSTTLPENYNPPEEYDVIFCLSFFSHMPKNTWNRWLQQLYSQLTPTGMLVITTHGNTAKNLRQIDTDSEGFYFTTESEQLDLQTSDYGYTIVTNDYVKKSVSELEPPAEIISWQEDSFWNIQDTYVIRKKV